MSSSPPTVVSAGGPSGASRRSPVVGAGAGVSLSCLIGASAL